ncbi:MAG: ABC transporter permease [Rhabdochlamydiaceae bacterium]|nr:ABC transporter permease [Rhabdochlamydiaceae bacterium]
MKKIISLIWKELLTVLRDRKVRLSILLPPIIQLFIFTYAATLDVKNVPIGILNRDNGEQAFLLVERFYGTKIFNNNIIFLKGVQEIGPFIDLQKGVMVVSIDEQFSRNLDAGKPATVQLILDGRKSNTAQIVAGYTGQIINRFNNDFTAALDLKIQNVELVPRTWFNPNTLYYWYNIPCLVGVLSMLICLVVTTQSVARERELGTFDQLLVSPLMPHEILIGKIIPGIIIGFIEGTFMLTMGTLVLGVPFTGSLLLYFMSLFIFVSSVSGIGLFISSLSTTQQQAMLGTFVFMVPSVLMSGFATPIENMPQWLQPFTYIIPLRYMLVISKGLFLKAMPAKIVLENAWPLIVISCVNFIGAAWFFRRRLE